MITELKLSLINVNKLIDNLKNNNNNTLFMEINNLYAFKPLMKTPKKVRVQKKMACGDHAFRH